MQQLGRGGSKEPLDHRPHAWVRGWTVFFRDKMSGEHRLKVDTPKLWATIDKAFLREPLMPLHTLAKGHHHGAITRWIIGHVAGQDASAVGIGQKRGPWSTQRFSGHRRNEFDV